jgi:hypothetical protein
MTPFVCPICAGAGLAEPVFEVAGHRYDQCSSCGSISIEPETLARLDRGEPLIAYGDAYWASELSSARERAFGSTLARMAEAVLYARRPIERFLDVGTGPGFFLDAIARYLPTKTATFHGVEKFPPPRERCSPSPQFIVGDVADVPFKVDAGICIEVVEHLTPRMLEGMLSGLAKVSNPEALFVVNTGMPAYVLHEDRGYLDPVVRGHVVSYSIEGLRRLCARTGFRVHPIPGKTWAFALELDSRARPDEDIRDRIWSALPENVRLLSDPEMGTLLYVLGLDTARAYR